MANAAAGQGQGLWQFSLFNTALNITTPANNIKAGPTQAVSRGTSSQDHLCNQTKSHPLRMTFCLFSVKVLSVLTVSAGGVCAANKSRISFK